MVKMRQLEVAREDEMTLITTLDEGRKTILTKSHLGNAGEISRRIIVELVLEAESIDQVVDLIVVVVPRGDCVHLPPFPPIPIPLPRDHGLVAGMLQSLGIHP